jgi:hypothetical protein
MQNSKYSISAYPFIRNYSHGLLRAQPGRGVGKHGSCLGRSGDGGATTNNIFNISKFLTLWNTFLLTGLHQETGIKLMANSFAWTIRSSGRKVTQLKISIFQEKQFNYYTF